MNFFNRYLKPKSIFGWVFPVFITAVHLFVDITAAVSDPRVIQSRIPLLIAFTVVLALGVVLPTLLLLVKLLGRAWVICGPTRAVIIGVLALFIGLLLSLQDNRGYTMGLTLTSFSFVATIVAFALVAFAKGSQPLFPPSGGSDTP